jgi:hypothetical protein
MAQLGRAGRFSIYYMSGTELERYGSRILNFYIVMCAVHNNSHTCYGKQDFGASKSLRIEEPATIVQPKK